MTVTASADEQFRNDLRAWLADAVASLPPAPPRDDWHARREYDCGWQARVYEAGYAGLGIPETYGGHAATLAQQLIFLEEAARHGAPHYGVGLVGLTHAAPTILSEGTEKQRQRFIPPILRGEEVWCQGFSETEAGSDLAALRCRAVRDGDDYVINGHKIWTTSAHVADWCEMLVRTDPDASRHKGITYLALPMTAEGITVRPIRTLVGEREFAEVVFDDVRCRMSHRIGPENDGWRVAMVTFSHERSTSLVYDIVRAQRTVEIVADLARNGPAAEDAGVQRELGRLAAAFDAMWAMTRRSVSDAMAGRPPGAAVSVGKVFVVEAIQRLDELAVKLLGPSGLVLDAVGGRRNAQLLDDRLAHVQYTISGGTSQVQRNIIAERVLGLPKEPKWPS